MENGQHGTSGAHAILKLQRNTDSGRVRTHIQPMEVNIVEAHTTTKWIAKVLKPLRTMSTIVQFEENKIFLAIILTNK